VNQTYAQRLNPATLITLFALLAGAAIANAAVASAAGGQLSEPSEPVTTVDDFLLARNLGDFSGAVGWCASLLEIQDLDGPRFLDAPAAGDWLHQLGDTYFIDTVRQPRSDGSTVTWTERLTRRGVPFREAVRSSITVEVQAVIRDGRSPP
jgi:hypothetical protein